MIAGTILIVDDIPQTHLELAALLAAAGYECHSAGSIDDALKMARHIEPDLVLAHVQIGPDPAVELQEELLLEPQTSEIPVVFFLDESRSDQLDGCDRRFSIPESAITARFPINGAELLTTIERVLWMPHLISTLENHWAAEPAAQ